MVFIGTRQGMALAMPYRAGMQWALAPEVCLPLPLLHRVLFVAFSCHFKAAQSPCQLSLQAAGAFAAKKRFPVTFPADDMWKNVEVRGLQREPDVLHPRLC